MSNDERNTPDDETSAKTNSSGSKDKPKLRASRLSKVNIDKTPSGMFAALTGQLSAPFELVGDGAVVSSSKKSQYAIENITGPVEQDLATGGAHLDHAPEAQKPDESVDDLEERSKKSEGLNSLLSTMDRDIVVEHVNRAVKELPAFIKEFIGLDAVDGFRIDILLNKGEYERKYGSDNRLDQHIDLGSYTSETKKVIAIFIYPQAGVGLKHVVAHIEGVLYHAVAHAIDFLRGARIASTMSPAMRFAKFPDGSLKQAYESHHDAQFCAAVEDCRKAITPEVLEELIQGPLNRYLQTRDPRELYAETFALAMRRGSDREAGTFLELSYQPVIEFWKKRFKALA